MQPLGYIRKIDELGRVVIPKSIRIKFNIDKPDDAVEFFSDGNGGIVLTKYIKGCIFCNSTEDIYEYENKYICNSCLVKLNNLSK